MVCIVDLVVVELVFAFWFVFAMRGAMQRVGQLEESMTKPLPIGVLDKAAGGGWAGPAEIRRRLGENPSG
jgi:hypothetical protein